MKKSFALLPLAALCAAMIAGCAADGTAYRSDVYSSSSVNRAQEVTTVEIIAISPGRVAVSNTENRDRAQMTGAILGAIAGAAIGNHNNHDTSSRVIGGLAGGAVGALAGDAVGGGSSTSFVEGVQLVYKTSTGRMLQSTQVGRPCEFKTGTAIMVSPSPSETRIQPNNPYGCPKN